MNLEDVIRRHYRKACAIQNAITSDKTMVETMQGRQRFDHRFVGRWMVDYGIFQGVNATERERVLMAIERSLGGINAAPIGTDREADIAAKYEFLFTALYNACPRRWVSATSKLLWCAFPDDIVIYDSFVERFVIVMQWFNDELADKPYRLGRAPKVEAARDIREAVDFYMRFQTMVYALFQQSQGVLHELREHYQEKYPYDIRIFDKLMWITSNPDESTIP